MLPLGRIGEPEDIAKAAVFLGRRPVLLDQRADLGCRRRRPDPSLDRRGVGPNAEFVSFSQEPMARRADGR